jgi:hypothetical protein
LIWGAAIFTAWHDPEHWKEILGGCLTLTIWTAIKHWAASRDDGLNPALKQKK